jgi:UTP--glucose-1-phosphate uridylyltransferase
MLGENTGLSKLKQTAEKTGMSCIGVMEVPRNQVDRYGIVAGEKQEDGVWRITDMVEKPARDKAPSNLAIIGRYILTPDIFTFLENAKPGHGGEIQLTDAMFGLAGKRGMLAVRMDGMRFDAGDWVQYLTANIHFALRDKAIGQQLFESLERLRDGYTRDAGAR